MSRYLPVDLPPVATAPVQTGASLVAHAASGWLLLGMGLAGVLSVALIVTADRSDAGVDPLRAVPVQAPQNEQDHPLAAVPLIGGLVAVIHDLAPVFLAPPPSPPDLATGVSPVTGSPRPASSPSPLAQPTASPAPAAQQPAVTTPPPFSTPTLTPSASPAPSNTSAPFIPPAPNAAPAPTLAISTDRGATAVVSLGDLVPGDSMIRTITVQNSGSLAFRYTVSATATAATALWTDPSHGLQLAVETTGGTLVYSGPLAGLAALSGPTTLAPGTTESLRYTFSFPASAPNSFQGLLQDLTLVFDAIQYP